MADTLHNSLTNHATDGALHNLHLPGYSVADVTEMNAITTGSAGDLAFVQSSGSYYARSGGGAWQALTSGAGVPTSILFTFDGGGSAITTGSKGDLIVDFNCNINQVTLLADTSGSFIVDIWKDTYANYPPTVADTITASAKPTLAGASKYQDSTLSGWTTAVGAGDILRFNVDSSTTVTRVLLDLKVIRT